LKISNFKLSLPRTPFNRLFLFWGVFLLANIAFSQSIPNSILSLTPLVPTMREAHNVGIIAGQPFSPALPISPSWLITLSSLGSSIKNALIGIGIGNFENAFTRFRPPSFNSNELWFWNFNRSISPALTVLIEQGFLGLSFWFLFFYKSYKSYSSYLSQDQDFYFPEKIRVIIKFLFFLIALSAISFLFFPLPISFFPLISLIPLIALISIHFLLSKKSFPPARLASIGLLCVAGGLISLIFLFSLFSPKISPASQMAIAENSLAEANKLSQSVGAQHVVPLQIKTLATSALSASSLAVSLNPENAAVHMTRLKLLISLTSQISASDRLISEEFVILLKLDPANPIVFRELGNFQFKNGDYYGSANSFKTAINLKGDYSPAWWSVAETYQRLAENAKILGNKTLEDQNLKMAQVALKETKRLVCEVHYEKVDCDRASKALKNP